MLVNLGQIARDQKEEKCMRGIVKGKFGRGAGKKKNSEPSSHQSHNRRSNLSHALCGSQGKRTRHFDRGAIASWSAIRKQSSIIDPHRSSLGSERERPLNHTLPDKIRSTEKNQRD